LLKENGVLVFAELNRANNHFTPRLPRHPPRPMPFMEEHAQIEAKNTKTNVANAEQGVLDLATISHGHCHCFYKVIMHGLQFIYYVIYIHTSIV
jgi:hypothetical protein